VTLQPIDPYHTGIEWGLQLRPLVSIVDVVTTSVAASVAVRIVVFNILLFVPLGFALMLRTRRWVVAVGAACCTSVAIETLQALLPLGRTTNVDDVILNAIGAAVGGGIAVAVLQIWALRSVTRRPINGDTAA
jgi:glycopeptide antibiotics resistance protein